MREAPTCTTWKITCLSPAQADALGRWLSSRIDPDRVFTDTVRTIPKGVPEAESVSHRLGDYFASVRLVPAHESDSFQLVFEKRPDAGRFWKDLMVNIVQEVAASP